GLRRLPTLTAIRMLPLEGIKAMRYPILTVSVLLTLSGCAATTTFVDRTNGQEYVGKTGSTATSEGDISALIEGSTYNGRWIYSASGGGYSLATGTAVSGGAMAVGTATGIAVSAQGNGLINIRDAAGSHIRCVFSFNEFSDTGIGACQRNDGREYDLRIKR